MMAALTVISQVATSWNIRVIEEMAATAFFALQQTTESGPLFILALVGAALGLLINVGALIAGGMRLGRFEGTMETKMASLEARQGNAASRETTASLSEKLGRIEIELERVQKDNTRAWRLHERKHEDQHHWVANSLQAIALTLNVKLPDRRRISDYDDDPEGD